jgi:hypothetical protein
MESSQLLTLTHKISGETKEVFCRTALYSQQWKKARKILVVAWELAGEYALDIDRNDLYSFGPGMGIRRKTLGWGAQDQDEARRLWDSLTPRKG